MTCLLYHSIICSPIASCWRPTFEQHSSVDLFQVFATNGKVEQCRTVRARDAAMVFNLYGFLTYESQKYHERLRMAPKDLQFMGHFPLILFHLCNPLLIGSPSPSCNKTKQTKQVGAWRHKSRLLRSSRLLSFEMVNRSLQHHALLPVHCLVALSKKIEEGDHAPCYGFVWSLNPHLKSLSQLHKVGFRCFLEDPQFGPYSNMGQ